ncbi:MAG: dipeptide epimerase [Bacteroidota bacterium]
MKITAVRCRLVPLELTRPYTIAYKTVSAVEICFVEIELENGLIGLGAANPSKQVVGQTTAACFEDLTATANERLVGQDIRHFPALCEHVSAAYGGKAGSLAAIDIALHDAYTKWLGIPLVAHLGQQIEQLPTSITIGIKGVKETVEEAQEYLDRGFRILKVKLGRSLKEDLERLRALRLDFGEAMGIRVDANQGYAEPEMLTFHRETKELGLELVEQPLPARAVEASKALPLEIRETIAADESLVTAMDAYELAAAPRACGIFNIKLMKCGGIYQARRIAEVARLAGIHLMWGCNDESVVSIAAALHVAFSCPHTRFIDLDGSLDLAEDLGKGGFVIQEGMMRLTDQPGLGVQAI